MPYKIDYLDGKGLIGTATCAGPLSRAQEIADKAIASKMADAVEVRDDGGALVYSRPRTLNNA